MLLGAALVSIYTVAVISGITPALSLAIAVAIAAICNFVTSRFIFSGLQIKISKLFVGEGLARYGVQELLRSTC